MKIAAYVALLLALVQQQVPFRNNIPVAPTGLAWRPLPKLPMEFDTAEGQRIRVSAVTTGLEYPFSLVFLPDGGMLVTERFTATWTWCFIRNSPRTNGST